MMTAIDPVLSMVGGQATEGFLVVVTTPPGGGPPDTFAFSVNELEKAQAFVSSMSRLRNVYVESAIQASEPQGRKRGNSANAAQLSLLSLDFDGAWGIHKESALPHDPVDLNRLLIKAGAPAPTLVLKTGGGLLVLWALQEPLLLAGSDRQRAQSLSRAFQQRLRQVARDEFSWRLDGTHDLCRLIRIPDTLNHKFAAPRPVEIWEEMSSGVAISLQEIEAFAKPSRAAEVHNAFSYSAEAHSGKLGDWASVLAGCAFARWCVENGQALPEPRWYALASLLSRCNDGAATFHEISALDPRYDRSETDAKLAHASAASAPRTCRSIHEDLGFEGCRRCVFWGHA